MPDHHNLFSTMESSDGFPASAVSSSKSPEDHLTAYLLAIVFGSALAMVALLVCLYYCRVWCQHLARRRRNRRQIKDLSGLHPDRQQDGREKGVNCEEDTNANAEVISYPVSVTIDPRYSQSQSQSRSRTTEDFANANFKLRYKSSSMKPQEDSNANIVNNNAMFTIGSDCSLDFNRDEVVYVVETKGDPGEEVKQNDDEAQEEEEEESEESAPVRPILVFESETGSKTSQAIEASLDSPAPPPVAPVTLKGRQPPEREEQQVQECREFTEADHEKIRAEVVRLTTPKSVGLMTLLDFAQAEGSRWKYECQEQEQKQKQGASAPEQEKRASSSKKAAKSSGAEEKKKESTPIAVAPTQKKAPTNEKNSAKSSSVKRSSAVPTEKERKNSSENRKPSQEKKPVPQPQSNQNTSKKSSRIRSTSEDRNSGKEANPLKQRTSGGKEEARKSQDEAERRSHAHEYRIPSAPQEFLDRQEARLAAEAEFGPGMGTRNDTVVSQAPIELQNEFPSASDISEAHASHARAKAGGTAGISQQSSKATTRTFNLDAYLQNEADAMGGITFEKFYEMSQERQALAESEEEDEEEEEEVESIGGTTTVTETTEVLMEKTKQQDKEEADLAKAELEDLMNFDAEGAESDVENVAAVAHGGSLASGSEKFRPIPSPKQRVAKAREPEPETRTSYGYTDTDEELEQEMPPKKMSKKLPAEKRSASSSRSRSRSRSKSKTKDEKSGEDVVDMLGQNTLGSIARSCAGATVTVVTTVKLQPCAATVVQNCDEEVETDNEVEGRAAHHHTPRVQDHNQNSSKPEATNDTEPEPTESDAEFPTESTNTLRSYESVKAEQSHPQPHQSEMHEPPKLSLRPVKEKTDLHLAPLNVPDEVDAPHRQSQGQDRPRTAGAAAPGPGQGCFQMLCKDAVPIVGSYGLISLLDFVQAEGGPRPHQYERIDTTNDALGFVTTNLQNLWDSAVNALPTGTNSGLITVDTSGCELRPSQRRVQAPEVVELHRSTAFKAAEENEGETQGEDDEAADKAKPPKIKRSSRSR